MKTYKNMKVSNSKVIFGALFAISVSMTQTVSAQNKASDKATAKSSVSCSNLEALQFDLKIANAESDMVWNPKKQKTERGVRYYQDRFAEELPSLVIAEVIHKSACKFDKEIKFELKVSGQKAKIKEALDKHGHDHAFTTTDIGSVELHSYVQNVKDAKALSNFKFNNIPILEAFEKLPEGQTFTRYTFRLSVIGEGGKKDFLLSREIDAPIGD